MKASINLMTEDARRDQLLRESKRLWARVLVGTVLVLALIGTYDWWKGRATTTHLRALEDRYAPVQTLTQQCLRMRKQINSMREAQQLTLRLVDTQPTVTLLGTLSAAAASTSGQVFLRSLQLQQPSSGSDERRAVVLGIGHSNTAIADFAAALRSSNLFADVVLSSSDSSPEGESVGRSFRIECKL